jgi:digeranylgeranylglycerophospholipid reductase
MKTVSDVIVVGGGPAGSFTAMNIAGQGVSVTVLEEHKEIGVPSHCAGHLSIDGLKRLGMYPLPAGIVENIFHGARFHSPSGRILSVHFPSPVTCAVNRELFDKHLAGLAKAAGVDYCLGSRVESLMLGDGGAVKGVVARREDNVERVSAKIVVDAEGVSSRLARQAGLPTLDRCWLFSGVEAEVENVKDIEQDTVEVFLGRDWAPGFFAWLIPKGEGYAKIGLGTRRGNPKELLHRLMVKHPAASKKLRNTRILRTIYHPITLGGPIPRTYSHGFMVMGDAASHVKSTTGGGIVLGLTCARFATDVAKEAIQRGDFSARFLSSYQRRCEEALGFDVKVMLRLRKMLDAMSDRQMDNAIDFCSRIGLDKALSSIKDIDFQGKSLSRLLPHPRGLAALGYLFYIYLSANP